MKNKFYLIFLPLILIFSACEDKHQNNKVTTTKEQVITEDTNTILIQTTITEATIYEEEPKKVVSKEYYYLFKNLKDQISTLHIKDDTYDFKNIKQSIVIVNVMSTWCPPCRGQLPHLSKLQQKFKENVFVMSTLVHDNISREELDKFIIAQKILFYVSITQSENLKFINLLAPKLGLIEDVPMPLTIVFVRGKYFTHYEGMIPEEMIESDIKQLLEKIKK